MDHGGAMDNTSTPGSGEIQVCLRSTRSSKQSKTLNSAEHPYLRTRRCYWQAGWWVTPCGLKA